MLLYASSEIRLDLFDLVSSPPRDLELELKLTPFRERFAGHSQGTVPRRTTILGATPHLLQSRSRGRRRGLAGVDMASFPPSAYYWPLGLKGRDDLPHQPGK